MPERKMPERQIRVKLAVEQEQLIEMSHSLLEAMMMNSNLNPETFDCELVVSKAIRTAKSLLEKSTCEMKDELIEEVERSLNNNN